MDTKLDKIANPIDYYKNPREVEKDDELTVEDKVKLLLNWLDDANLRQIAEAENMPSDEDSRYYIREITRLLRKYHAR